MTSFIPDYLSEPIDIMSDSVTMIAEKAAYKAHGGTYVEGLWDASPSTIVSLMDEQPDWQPLKLELHGGDLGWSMDYEVSDVPQFCLSSGNHDFFGYQSEPPVAPAFREEKPVGLATPALQALGNLNALLEYDGDTQSAAELNEMFCQMWGAKPDDLQNMRYLKPDLDKRSKQDLIKSVRSKTHRIYGYENEQNYISTSGGGYTSSSFTEKRYVDWHRIYLVLRFIGVNMMVSDALGRERLWGTNHTMLFGLTASEFPLVTNAPHCPYLGGVNPDPPALLLSESLNYSLAYYSSDRVLTSVDDRNRLAESKIKLGEHVMVPSEILAAVRARMNKRITSVQLDFRPSKQSSYDIFSPDGTFTGTPVQSKIQKLDIHHLISPHRAYELVLVSTMLSMWGGRLSVKIRDILDLLKRQANMSAEERAKIARFPADCIGHSCGSLVWRVMRTFREDAHQANIDFTEYCLDVIDSVSFSQEVDRNALFWECNRSQGAFKRSRDLIQSAYQKVIHFYNVPKIPARSLTAKLSGKDELTSFLFNVWKNKLSYWHGHYIQRKDQMMQRVTENLPSKPSRLQKSELVRYQWLIKWMPNYHVEVTDGFQVWPSIDNSVANKLLAQTTQSFMRKQANMMVSVNPLDDFRQNLRSTDRQIKPKISFYETFKSVDKSMREMTRDVHTVLKSLFEPKPPDAQRDPFGYEWQQSLSASAACDDLWTEYVNSLPMDDDDTLVELVDGYDQIKSIRQQMIDGEYRSFAAKNQPSDYVKQPSRPNSPELTDDPNSLQDTIEFDPDYEEEDFDDMDFDDDVGVVPKKKFGGPDLDKVLERDNLGLLSPVSQLRENFGKHPDLLAWAARCGVDVEFLTRCGREDFERIYEAGKELMFETGLAKLEDEVEYDVVSRK